MQSMIDAYWDPRHRMCIIDSPCRMQDAVISMVEQLLPAEPDPGSEATLAAYTAWAERMRIRQRILEYVH
jgi:hypothetical protein